MIGKIRCRWHSEEVLKVMAQHVSKGKISISQLFTSICPQAPICNGVVHFNNVKFGYGVARYS